MRGRIDARCSWFGPVVALQIDNRVQGLDPIEIGTNDRPDSDRLTVLITAVRSAGPRCQAVC